MSRRTLPLLLATLLGTVLAGACDGNPMDSGETSPKQTTLDQTEITLTALGDSARVRASNGVQTTQSVSLSLVQEQRYLGDVAVLDSAALLRGRIVSRAPGRVVLNVHAFGNPAVRLGVQVAPPQPLVVDIVGSRTVGDGDTLHVRGYRLHEIDPAGVRVGDQRADVLTRDSANLRLAVPSVVTQSCTLASAPQALRIAGAVVPDTFQVRRTARGSLRLQIGDYRRLSPEEQTCLRLQPRAGAKYGLAHFDTRIVLQARTQGEASFYPTPDQYRVSIRDITAPPAQTSRSPSLARLPRIDPPHFALKRTTGPRDFMPAYRDRPWTLGEQFGIFDPQTGAEATARIVRLAEPNLAIALADEDTAHFTPKFQAQMDSALTLLNKHAYPLFQELLLDQLPITSPQAGQLLVVLSYWAHGAGTSFGVAVSYTRNEWAEVHTEIHYNLLGDPDMSSAWMAYQIGHEIAHAFQNDYLYATNGGSGKLALASNWAEEGGADLMIDEALRRWLQQKIDGNLDWWDQSLRRTEPRYPRARQIEAMSAFPFTHGYATSANYLRHLALQRMDRGETELAAVSAVIKGGLEGWYGYDGENYRRTGLSERMKSLLGPEWNPTESLMMWTLAQIADDLTDVAELQNRSFRCVQQACGKIGDGGTSGGWRGWDILAAGSGQTKQENLRFGSPDYLWIQDTGLGAALHLSADLPGVEWWIVRTH